MERNGYIRIPTLPQGDSVSSTTNAFSHMYQRISELEIPDSQAVITYVWIDGSGIGLRSKVRVLKGNSVKLEDIPIWEFDGSSTDQAQTQDSDIFLNPVRMYRDPFRPSTNSFLVLCETLNKDNTPTATSHRQKCKETLRKCEEHEPWFGIEQEYTILDAETMMNQLNRLPINDTFRRSRHYCGAGTVIGRYVCDLHLQACLYAGIDIYGTNAEVAPGQWEFQLGPSDGLLQSDNLWIARYILVRVAEEFDFVVSFHPKPTGKGSNCSGSGAHTNFSTNEMRKPEQGIVAIRNAISLLEKAHPAHMKVYDPNNGEDNLLRLCGMHETSKADKFNVGNSDRKASVRLPRNVVLNGCGYLEDRRPASSCDPYLVCERIAKSKKSFSKIGDG